MRYIIAIFFPSIAMLLCGKMFQAVMCLILQLTVIGWFPATVWAFFVIHSHKEDVRHRQLMRAVQQASPSV